VTEEEIETPPPSEDDLKNENISTQTQEGEETIQAPTEPVVSTVIQEEEEEIVAFVQAEPEYPGGIEKLYEDIYKNITYPEMEKENNIQGTVYVSFVVEKTGSITDIKIDRGVNGGPNLSKEAEKAVRKLKPFTPAKMNGKSVRYRYRVPIKFILR
jgi:protein TonB